MTNGDAHGDKKTGKPDKPKDKPKPPKPEAKGKE